MGGAIVYIIILNLIQLQSRHVIGVPLGHPLAPSHFQAFGRSQRFYNLKFSIETIMMFMFSLTFRYWSVATRPRGNWDIFVALLSISIQKTMKMTRKGSGETWRCHWTQRGRQATIWQPKLWSAHSLPFALWLMSRDETSFAYNSLTYGNFCKISSNAFDRSRNRKLKTENSKIWNAICVVCRNQLNVCTTLR